MAPEGTQSALGQNYDPKSSGTITWHDAVPNFLEGNDTPRAYLERCLETIEIREPTVRAFVSIDIEVARKAADKATIRFKNNQPLSAVDGMPFIVKDLYEVKGMPTELGSPAMRGYGGDKDCAHARAMRDGGAVILAKSVTTEFGSSDPGPTRNPFDQTRTPGGSSSGTSAAVGAGFVPAGSGSQVRGSILRPAGYCSNFALKPTFGALNRLGGHSMAPSQSVLGIQAGAIEDVWNTAFYISSIAGGDPGHPGLFGEACLGSAKNPTRLVRLDSLGWDGTENETKAKFDEFLGEVSDLGIEIVSRKDDPDIEAFEMVLRTIPDFLGDMFCWEMQWPGKMQRDKGEQFISQAILDRIAHGETMTIEDYRRCLDMRQALRDSFETVRGKADAFILLSAQGPAPLASTGIGNPIYGDVTSCLGAPGYNLPLLEDRGMPMGIQIMGFPHDDFVLGQIGKWFSEEFLG
ncbi:MAG: amidase [Rhodospirillaceae bacterium]|nr:amidase [Rhodospirillaceae bacterium]|tara:strand:+ start:17583 stop:18971 length:1389 start_codon:yes stop_codon:yes gene_type:complete